MPPSRGVLVQCAWLAAAACAWLAVGATGGGGRPLVVLARGAQAEVRALKGEERAGAHYEHMASQFRKAEQVAAQELADAHRKGPIDTLRTASERLDVALARKEMQSIEAKGGPRQPLFPAFAGRAVKGFPYNVMGNLMSAVNAV